ncbi:cation transport protein-domain-containing protein [Zychaea mexicana]|uniref:cation transport protein-domain-containing protein n=1 Tax=Zychaea mexicana TaxID=64656 RepID=UPI0022FED4FE|nr:cation transport protein-domain-containing protein [Zychaea mexicana]KAI9494167.1 cation transport protein-domain-containing protein [Zychaea mexicana]
MLCAEDLEDIKEWCHDIWHRRINFLVIHYTYIISLCLIVSGFFYCQPGTNWNYADALFMSTTAVTNTGLNTVEISALSLYQLLLMFFVSILGNHVTVSEVIVLIRRHYFSKRFEDVLLFNRAQRLREKNRQRFNKNLADVHAKMQQESKTNSNAMPLRSSTLPTPHHGILPHLRLSATMARFQPFHALKGGIGHHLRHNRELEEQKIYDKLRELRDKDAERSTVGGSSHQGTLTPDRVMCPMSTSTPTLRRADSTPKGSIPLATTTSAYTIPSSNALEQHVSSSSPAPPQNIAFADNIDRQRSEARKELENDRPYNELLRRIAEGRHPDSPLDDDDDDDDMLVAAEIEREEIKSIMRGPIHKYELTRKQRYAIGGAEYRALDFLANFIPIVYFGTNILFSFAMRIYVAADDYAQEALRTSNSNGPVDPWFFSIFTTFSAYNNLGLSPLAASLTPFLNAPAPLLLLSFTIMMGNVGYAIVLRFYIWCLYKLMPRSWTMDRETLRYLLDHPRRCYTSLFPATQTWWLVFVLVAINSVEFIVFLATNYWLPVLDGISWGSRVLLAYFQGVSVRNAGFTAINLLMVNPGTQIVYIIAMYVSIYPIGISIRNSNVYQERELGIYSSPTDQDEKTLGQPPPSRLRRFPTMSSVMTQSKKLIPKGPSFYVKTQIQRQLAQEICWVVAGIFCICVIEAQSIMSPAPITALTVIYECVSAFGNSGSSTGYPGVTTSQAGSYRTLSKLVLIALMVRGRHRGLPSAIDHAVLLPSDRLEEREEQEHRMRRRHAEVSQDYGDPNNRWRSRTFSMA